LLDQGADKYPKSPYASETLYEAGWAQQNLGKLDDALALYQQVVGQSGALGHEAAARAQFMIGEIQFEKKIHDEAIRSFFKVIGGYSFPQWQAEATYEAARCFEVLKKPSQAVKLYKELIERYPESDKVPLAQKRVEAIGG
jgi:TolA-binding protein